MMFTLYSADYVSAPGNCSYPHKIEVTDTTGFADAVKKDYVCAEYMNSYRNNDNFIGSDCLPVDCDNDHSENPADPLVFQATVNYVTVNEDCTVTFQFRDGTETTQTIEKGVRQYVRRQQKSDSNISTDDAGEK